MDQSQQIPIPQEYSGKLREIWQDRQGVHAAAAPGYYFDTPPSYILHAKTKETLLEAFCRLRQEEFHLLDGSGQALSVMPYGEACSLLKNLRPDYSLVSCATEIHLEAIQPTIARKHIDCSRMALADGSTIYQTGTVRIWVREEEGESGSVHLIPVEGMQATVQKDWTMLPEHGLRSFCTILERQRNEGRCPPDRRSPVLRVIGDCCEPLMHALLDLCTTNPEVLGGLIEVCPCEGLPLQVMEVQSRHRIADGISQLLQDNGYESASKFLDCSMEL